MAKKKAKAKSSTVRTLMLKGRKILGLKPKVNKG